MVTERTQPKRQESSRPLVDIHQARRIQIALSVLLRCTVCCPHLRSLRSDARPMRLAVSQNTLVKTLLSSANEYVKKGAPAIGVIQPLVMTGNGSLITAFACR